MTQISEIIRNTANSLKNCPNVEEILNVTNKEIVFRITDAHEPSAIEFGRNEKKIYLSFPSKTGNVKDDIETLQKEVEEFFNIEEDAEGVEGGDIAVKVSAKTGTYNLGPKISNFINTYFGA